ncbi:MAG: hypothetical protein NWQ41_09540, partial [Saprospiraceae bacterium]|nr:hypothetical protein [Saprospiraceae bacterium]
MYDKAIVSFLSGRLSLLYLALVLSISGIYAQYSGGMGSGYAGSSGTGMLPSGGSCNCGTPVSGGNVAIAGYPECQPDGNYPNEFPLVLEFLAGGGTADPAAIEGHYWMLEFRDLTHLCSVWSFPFTLGDTLYEATRTGNSIRVRVDFRDLDTDNACSTVGFEGFSWDYRVVQLCNYPDKSCFSAGTRDTFHMQRVLDMFDVRSNSDLSAYVAPAKIQYGFCKTEAPLDLLLGEVLTIGNDSMDQHWNDVRPSTQYINICGLDNALFPAPENYKIVLKDMAGNEVGQSYFDKLMLDPGDMVRLDTVWFRDKRCLQLRYTTDGDRNFDKWQVFASGELLPCESQLPVTMNRMESRDFRLSWNARMKTTGHGFRLKLYEGGTCTPMGVDTAASRPNTDNTHIFETLLRWDDPRLLRLHDTLRVGAGDNYLVRDSFQLRISELGFTPNPCNCYQAFVYQVCDGMDPRDTGDLWGAAFGKTYRTDVDCEAIEASLSVSDEICEVKGGGFSFDITGYPCTAFEIEVNLTTAGLNETWRYYSSGYQNGIRVFSDDEFLQNGNIGETITFSLQDTLMHGDYRVKVTVRDTLAPGTADSCIFPVSIQLTDLLKPSARIWMESIAAGAQFVLDDQGEVHINHAGTALSVVNNAVNLGQLRVPEGTCGLDLDMLLEVYDECAVYLSKLPVRVEAVAGSVSGEIWQGRFDSLRVGLVHIGTGTFAFDIVLEDGSRFPELTTNRIRFIGEVLDATPPQLRVPGNLVYALPECSPTTPIFLNLQATDACTGAVEVSAAQLGGTLVWQELGNGLFLSENVYPGRYLVTVSGLSDPQGNMAPAQDIEIVVQGETATSPRSIIGTGNLSRALPSCIDAMDIDFDLFVIDFCTPDPVFDSILVSGGYPLEGDLSGHRFAIRDMQPGRVEVRAFSGGATYSFSITMNASLHPREPEVRIPGNLSFTLPVCSAAGEQVRFSVQVRDDCDDPAWLAAHTRFFRDGMELSPSEHQLTGSAVTFLFEQNLSISDHQQLFEVWATDSDGHQTRRQFRLNVYQEKAALDFTCGDQLNVLTGSACGTSITPSMVLKGDATAICNDQLQVLIEKKNASGAFEGYYTLNEVIGTGLFKYAVLPKGSEYLQYQDNRIIGVRAEAIVCWGTLLVEDKTLPLLDCPADRYEVIRPHAINTWQGVLAFGKTFSPELFSCYQTSAPFEEPGIARPYATWTFRPSTSGKYTFSVSEAEFPATLALFQQTGNSIDAENGYFDPLQPCTNIVAFGDADHPSIRITLPLLAKKAYTLLMISREAALGGTFEVVVERDGAYHSSEPMLEYPGLVQDSRGNVISGWRPHPVGIGLRRLPLYVGDREGVSLATTQDRCYTIQGNYRSPEWDLATGHILKHDAHISDVLAARLLLTGFPVVQDNCGTVTVCVADRWVQQSDCGASMILRSFSATDQYGNRAAFAPGVYTCTQRISFAVPAISNLVLPNYTTYAECDEGLFTGYPYLISATGYHDLSPEWGNLAASYQDVAQIPACGASSNIRRQWTILDWCRPGQSVLHNQLIKIGDYTAPTIDVSIIAEGFPVAGDTLVYAVSPFDCDADFWAPRPVVRDNCAGFLDISYEIQELVDVPAYDHFGNLVGILQEWQQIRDCVPGTMVRGIPLGKNYRYVFQAADECGNSSMATVPFVIRDRTAPTGACNDTLIITLGGENYGQVHKSDLQEGIQDNCAVQDYQIRRSGTQLWGDIASFDCRDIEGYHEVELKVTDLSGNEGICTVRVLVEDKT